jgi:hypothetical protein
MSWIAPNPGRYAGNVVGTGHCVVFVQQAASLPHTSQWRRGIRVRGAGVLPGTAIATFSAEGRYENRTDGSSHAAILIAELKNGLRVWDQWTDHPVAERTIRWGGGKPSNDGEAFFVIESAADA